MDTTVLPRGGDRWAASEGAPRLWVVLALGSCGGLAAAGLTLLAFASDTVQQPGLNAFLACWLTVPYVGAGLIAWRRRPESQLGVLMVTAGFVTAVNFLVWADNDVLYLVGSADQFLPPAVFLHVFLAFPSGRLDRRIDRVVVAAAYGSVALTLPRLALGQGGARNLVAVADEPDVVAVLRGLQLAIVSALLVAGVVLLFRSRRRHGHPLRASMGRLVDAFSVALLMIATLYLVQLFGWTSIAEETRLVTFAVVGLAPIVFLAALLQARLGRASAAELLVELGVNPGPAELQQAVARALRDPSVTLAYWLPEFDSYADVDGRQIDLEQVPGRSSTPIIRDKTPVAMMLHDSALDDEPQLLASVAAAIGVTIQNAQLQVELRARLEELRGSRMRILEAEGRERRRLERDLHDGAQQRLIALSLELGSLGDRLAGEEDLGARIASAQQEVAASLAELRDLARGIHPAMVTDHGLAVAFESLATRATVPVEVIGATADRLPEPVELAAFYIVCEALANVAKHSRASSAVIRLERRAASLLVEVTDDGIGGATADTGSGLRGLADRVEAMGGRIQVWSPPDRGTRLRAEIPCG